MKDYIKYSEKEGKYLYSYPGKNTEGSVELWFESYLSKYNNLIFSQHSDEQFKHRGFTREYISGLLKNNILKIVWRPNYKSDSRMDARITIKTSDNNYISIIVANDLLDNGDLLVYTAYPVNHSKDDIVIYEKGEELFARHLDFQEFGDNPNSQYAKDNNYKINP
jgi:hypothetical protein